LRGEVVVHVQAAGVDRHQVVLHAPKFAQPAHSRGRIATAKPLESDQSFLPGYGAARLPDHQLQRRAHTRIIELLDESIEIEAEVGALQLRRSRVSLDGPQSIAVHQ
jgi:hypothetical protein